MGLSTSGRTWEDASSPIAVRLARRFEAAWRGAEGRRPDPDEFLPPDHSDCPGARLALLRADLTLRWEAGERVRAEWYRDRYPDLDDETLVALIYEEFCLREEEDDAPVQDEYVSRFPEVASRLRRVFDIHGLVGSGQTTAMHAPEPQDLPFPAAGQTIAGFHLVEELGRGAFARVFLAEERQLADRPVALKVARSGSREPQTLARLQHTHIVPVHSSRTDPATGLHLLCMPYFGRVTLARLLADGAVKVARNGSDLLEALDRLGTEKPPSGRSAGRVALARRSYALAMAWWGSRMAEALEHAHERGVLHRDIKPSNVLLTGEAMPMLLDFNLAREVVADDPDAAAGTLGGTLDYMAPEHLEALADGLGKHVDARSDIYGLGVLLYEALGGDRPFSAPKGALSAADLLLRAAEERRAGAPSVRDAHPEVPAALDAVVRRCLEPEPEDRYASAGELAADLQAVADDRPLLYAREPLASRAVRWSRRNRRALAMAVPVLVALAIATGFLIRVQAERGHRLDEVSTLLTQGNDAFVREDFATAVAKLEAARGIAQGKTYLVPQFKKAVELAALARQIRDIRDKADRLFEDAGPLRFRLTRFLGDLPAATEELSATLAPFYVLANPNWASLDDLKLLDPGRLAHLKRDVNELLFLWVVAVSRERADSPGAIASAVETCDRALIFASPTGPWKALRARVAAQAANSASGPTPEHEPADEVSALACFQWGQIHDLEGRHARALDWYRRAARHEPMNYWHQYYLAYKADAAGRSEEALRHYEAAIARDDRSPWAHMARGEMWRDRGALPLALDDLQQALNGFEALRSARGDRHGGPELRLTRLALGYVRQRMGDMRGARADYDALIAQSPDDSAGRAARFNRAMLNAQSGAVSQARAECDALIAANPADLAARQGRALLALREGKAGLAEADFDELVRRRGDARSLAERSLARLLLGRAKEAEADAAAAVRQSGLPGYRRLWTRTLLALGRTDELPIDRPDELAMLPLGGPRLYRDLRAAANRLEEPAAGTGAAALSALLTRSLLLAALRDPAADADATRAVALSPLSPYVYLIRGRVRLRLGRLAAAREDADRGLALDPDNDRLLELRGVIHTESGEPERGLADLDQANRLGAPASIHGARAAALLTLGRFEEAAADWTRALEHDADDSRAYFGRARAYLGIHQPALALADLEQAASWADGLPELSVRIALLSVRCLDGQPDRLARVVSLARRAWVNCAPLVASR